MVNYKDIGGRDSSRVWSNQGLTGFRAVTTFRFKRIRSGLFKRTRVGREAVV